MTTSRAGSCRPAYPNGFMLGLDLRVASRAREATGQPPGSYTATTPARSCRSQRWWTRRCSIRTARRSSSTAWRLLFGRSVGVRADRPDPSSSVGVTGVNRCSGWSCTTLTVRGGSPESERGFRTTPPVRVAWSTVAGLPTSGYDQIGAAGVGMVVEANADADLHGIITLSLVSPVR